MLWVDDHDYWVVKLKEILKRKQGPFSFKKYLGKCKTTCTFLLKFYFF